jgi:sugar/nucleoside kinase (ribokinase family)
VRCPRPAPVGTDPMGDNLLAELDQCGVDTAYSFRAGAASPRTLILLDDSGERTIIAVDSGAEPSSFLSVHGPDLRSVDASTSRVTQGTQPAQRPRLSRLFSRHLPPYLA